MSNNDDSTAKSNQLETTSKRNAETQDEEDASNRRPLASFSMAYALSMVRRRQQEQQRAQQEQEAILDHERKEKARAKRRRRRQNQKLAKANAKAEPGAEAEAEQRQVEQSMNGSDEESHDMPAAIADSAKVGDVTTQSEANKTTTDSTKLPPKKRIKLNGGASNPTVAKDLKSSSIAASSGCEAQNEGNSSSSSVAVAAAAQVSQNAIKLRSLVPRAVMLRKPAGG